MAKANIRETMKKSVDGKIFFDEKGVEVVVDGFETPFKFEDLFTEFHGKSVKIDMDTKTEYRPEDDE